MSAKGGTYQHLMIAELKILLNNHWTLIVLAVYVLFTCGVYFSESFRQTWLQVLDGNLFTTMINLLAYISLYSCSSQCSADYCW